MSIDRHIEIVENNDPVKKYNFIGLVIDESGSMGTMYDQAISLSSMVEGLEKEGNWTFPILGANIDLQKLCSRIGIKTGGTMNFSHDSIGDASVVMSSGLTGYYGARSRGDTQVRDLYASESNDLGDEDDRSSS